MTPQTRDAICGHALRAYPAESCGLVVIAKGRERYVPCRNMATTASEHFVLAAEDYATAEDYGEVAAVVHSHPDASSRPSEGDRVACEQSGLPWIIVSVMPGGAGPSVADVFEMAPEGYTAPLVGRPFQHGILDCWGLCRDWYARTWGLMLPSPHRPDNWWDDGHSDLYGDTALRAAGFLPATDPWRAGDLILMQVHSKNDVPNHAAIYLGDGWMLHHFYGRLSSRDRWGGYWSDCFRSAWRHREACSHLDRVV